MHLALGSRVSLTAPPNNARQPGSGERTRTARYPESAAEAAASTRYSTSTPSDAVRFA